MNIFFTDEAITFIEAKYTNKQLHLKFLHDSKGCGCADAGVPTLAFIEAPTKYDVLGTSNAFPFYYQPEQAVYYDKNLKVGFNSNYHCLTLSSDAQIYSNGIRLLTNM